MKIADEKFVILKQGGNAGSLQANLAAVQGVLEDGQATYVAVRTDEANKFLLVFYVPENAAVRDKMMYASSRAALKEGL